MFSILIFIVCFCIFYFLFNYNKYRRAVNILMFELIIRFRYHYNDILYKIKAKNVNKCGRVIYEYYPVSIKCNEYTYNILCGECAQLKRWECAAYHFEHSPRIQDVEWPIMALVEHQQREAYRYRYGLQMDRGHQIRLDRLWDRYRYDYEIRRGRIYPILYDQQEDQQYVDEEQEDQQYVDDEPDNNNNDNDEQDWDAEVLEPERDNISDDSGVVSDEEDWDV